jgi:pilus assembly protein Flp/PilA
MLYIYNLIAMLSSRVEGGKDRGATATEYAILVAFIALLIIGGVTIFGNALSGWFSDLADNIGL